MNKLMFKRLIGSILILTVFLILFLISGQTISEYLKALAFAIVVTFLICLGVYFLIVEK